MNPVRNKKSEIFADTPKASRISYGMKVLIGTPIHERKDYSMERWLANVAKLRLEYPADLLLVDNSPGTSYVKKVKSYCAKYGITNYKIKHLEILQGRKSRKNLGEQIHERIARSREIIRQEFLSADYDAYFFWENDVIIPSDGLGKLVALMRLGNFMIIDHNCWTRTNPRHVNFDYGIVLLSRACLEKYSWLPGSDIDPKIPHYWYEAELRFRKRIHQDGCRYTEVEGLIEPVYHLAK